MSDVRPAGPFPLPNAGNLETWLVRFDKDGVCTSPSTRAALLARVDAQPADVIFFSHGWQTDFNGATDQYGRFLKALNQVLADHPLPDKKILFVGITWPSKWIASTEGPKMAGAGDGGEDEYAEALTELTARLTDAENDRARELAALPVLSRDEAREFAQLLAKGSAPTLGETSEALAPDDAIKLAAELSPAAGVYDPDHVGSATGDAGGAAAASDGFDGFTLVRLFSIYQMKDRAGRVGARGVASLLTDLTARARSVHLVGHSFGAKVMLSALLGEPARARKPNTMLLLQPAISHLCFAPELDNAIGKGGYSAAPGLVSGQIFTTYSRHDFPLRNVFHLALRRARDIGEAKIAGDEPPNKHAALGGFGPRSAGEVLLELPASGGAYAVPDSAKIVALDASPDKRVPSHGDVQNVHTAWALRRQIEKG